MVPVKDIPVGEVFAFRGELEPKLKIEDGYIDLRIRTEHHDREEDEAQIITIEMLCVIMHREEILDWVNGARAFFIPPKEEEEATA